MADLWDVVRSLTTTEAVCLLALDHIEEDGENPLGLQYVEVQEVAAVTGLSASTVGAALRQLAKAEHVNAVPYLATATNGRPCVRVGYSVAEVEG